MSEPEALIRSENLVKSYELGKLTVPVLKSVSFTVQPKEFIALLGPSGSGKSTLLNLLGGLDRPTSGTLTVAGQNLGQQKDTAMAVYRQKTVGMIFQSFNLLAHLSGEQNVLMPALLAGHDLQQSKARAKQLLERVGMWARKDHRPAELSGGEQQRIAIVRSLMNQPKLLLADEPTGNLDSITSQEIMTLLKEIHHQDGMTIMVVTHDENLAMLADRRLRMKDGLIESTS